MTHTCLYIFIHYVYTSLYMLIHVHTCSNILLWLVYSSRILVVMTCFFFFYMATHPQECSSLRRDSWSLGRGFGGRRRSSCWLVVWNIFCFPIYWLVFFRGIDTTNQFGSSFFWSLGATLTIGMTIMEYRWFCPGQTGAPLRVELTIADFIEDSPLLTPSDNFDYVRGSMIIVYYSQIHRGYTYYFWSTWSTAVFPFRFVSLLHYVISKI